MMIKKVLIAIDDSAFAEHAAEYGFDIARKFNAAVGLVNIIEPAILMQMTSVDPILGMPMQGAGMEQTEMMDMQKQQSENTVDNAIKKFAGDIQVSHFTEYGATADGIIKCAKEFGADIIVIGTHSRTGLDRFLSGSVAEHVVRHSEVPVLVVPFKSESQ